jgi:membrane fusion protein (multidrug efflux system)
MSRVGFSSSRITTAIRSVTLFGVVAVLAGGLALWKGSASAEAAGGAQPEPVEAVAAAVAQPHEYRDGATAIGTVVATRSITLRNELAGTVSRAPLTSGQVVDAGTLLIALDVSVEEAELSALEARAQLARATLERMERMAQRRAASAIELDNARAERDVALADIARVKALIGRKTLRAPFRARVGISDVHEGQFLDAGTVLTTLQGIDDEAHIDFAVSQSVAASLRAGSEVRVVTGPGESDPIEGRVVALDARVDPRTRNATIRARVEDATSRLVPGASVRVWVPAGPARLTIAVPASALRKGPGGDHVFVLETAEGGETRARVRPVEAGPATGDEVVIFAGLEAGERVAAAGSFKLRDGVLVQVSDGARMGAGKEE